MEPLESVSPPNQDAMSTRCSERLLEKKAKLAAAPRRQQEYRERLRLAAAELSEPLAAAQRRQQECRQRQRLAAATPLNQDAPENQDAHDYHNRLRDTCMFLTCAVCALEDGLKEMQELNLVIKSAVNVVMLQFWASFERNFPIEVVSSLEQPGFLVGANHICKLCLTQLNSQHIPKKALVNGFCCGPVPLFLSILNRTEISMIAIINPMVKLEVHKGGLKSRTDVISFTNDVSFVATSLPRLPQAILRSKSREIQHYRPGLIFDALSWLKVHNELYSNVDIIFPPAWSTLPQVVVPEIMFDENLEDDHHDNATNPSAEAPQETFIVNYGDALSSLSTMAALVMERPSGNKVQRHECDNFEGMAFPILYPYGVGFPLGIQIDWGYINHRIRCGGSYRRFSETTDWLFTHYSYELRKKNGGIAAQAAKLRETNDRVDDQDTSLLINFLKSNAISDPAKMARIRKILKLVQPFAAAIPGSILYMDIQRNRLRSVVNSPITTKNGHWRWFFTQSQSDLHSPLIFDNLVCSDSSSIEDRHAKCDALSKVQRKSMFDQCSLFVSFIFIHLEQEQRRMLLIKNPVMPVRIWKLQQRAFFDCILNGCSKPLGGDVVDWVDKTEFQMKSTIHSHYMLCIHDLSMNEDAVAEMTIATEQKIIGIVSSTMHANNLQVCWHRDDM